MSDDCEVLIREAKTYQVPRFALPVERAAAVFVVRLCDALETQMARAEVAEAKLAALEAQQRPM